MNRTSSSRIDAASLARGLLAAGTVFSFLTLAGSSAQAQGVLEPFEYRMDDYRAPTPKTLEGAKVVTVSQAREIWHAGKTVFIDVMPRPVKPADLPNDTLWRDKVRETIPGAVWLPNVGYGQLPPDVDEFFRKSLEELTKGDKAKPLLFFCMANCWMSWNAAKRAMEEYGYTEVTWFPQGTDGWGFPDSPLVKVEPRPLTPPPAPKEAEQKPDAEKSAQPGQPAGKPRQ
jgi:PQQ-dependent catabolism-associated CXXCW motif protein